MTREEAKRILYVYRAVNLVDASHREAFNMAIKAVEQEPCEDIKEIREVMSCDTDEETKCKMISNILTAKPHYFKEQQPCDDAISRQAALDAFGLSEKTRKYGGDHSGYNTMMLYEIQDVIEDLPPVSTEKTGRWIKIKPYPLQMHDYECSECGHETDDNTEKHCSECGAKMEVVECEDAISRHGEKNISKGFEDFMIKSLRKQAESENEE